jgi:replicative superfamily II helicase
MFILSGEPSRGAHLECLVAKIKHLNNTAVNTTSNTTANTSNNTSNSSGQSEASERIQLIAMSATVGNLRELAHFLSAELFTDDWRPVRLEEFVKVGRDIFQVAGVVRLQTGVADPGSGACFDSGVRDG